MKGKMDWWKIVKVTMIAAIGVFCVVGLTGCGGDDDGGGGGTWRMTMTLNGVTTSIDFEMPGDLSEMDDGTFDLDGMTMTINGSQITISGTADGMTLDMEGIIDSSYESMSGDITATYGGDTYYGTWSMEKL